MTQFYPDINDELIVKYLLGEATKEEQEFVQEATKANAQFAAELEKFRHTLDMVSLYQIDTAKAWSSFSAKYKSRQHFTPQITQTTRFSLRKLAVAASVIVLLGVAAFFGYRSLISSSIQAIATYEPVDVVLKDGSQVTLNRESQLSYPRRFAKNNRTVELIGEAFFNIVHDEEKPFIVQTAELTVTVLGTSFYVRAYPGEMPEVTVESGRVQCYYKPTGESIVLEAGETAVFGTKTTEKRKTSWNDLNTYAWKTFNLRFENESLSHIIQLVNKAYGSNIIIEGSIGDCRLTVNFNNLSINGVINVLQSILDIKYVKTKESIILKGNGC